MMSPSCWGPDESITAVPDELLVLRTDRRMDFQLYIGTFKILQQPGLILLCSPDTLSVHAFAHKTFDVCYLYVFAKAFSKYFGTLTKFWIM